MKLLLFAIIAISGTFATDIDQWDAFKIRFEKRYETIEEEIYRRAVFETNLEEIRKHEELRQEGKVTFSMGITPFADMTTEEYVKTMLSPLPIKTNRNIPVSNVEQLTALPTTVDWRTTGCVRAVANGGTCSLWPVTSLLPIEVQQCNATGTLVRLSVQNIWDCTGTGCSALINEAYDYIVANGGVDTEASYPTTGLPGTCKYNPDAVGARITGYLSIAAGDEIAMQTAVATIGPLSTAVDASHVSFQLYTGGVYYEPTCSSDTLDLPIPIVGYGTQAGADYWLCQNDWGTSWGEQGYIKMARNQANNCGIATSVTHPVGVSA